MAVKDFEAPVVLSASASSDLVKRVFSTTLSQERREALLSLAQKAREAYARGTSVTKN